MQLGLSGSSEIAAVGASRGHGRGPQWVLQDGLGSIQGARSRTRHAVTPSVTGERYRDTRQQGNVCSAELLDHSSSASATAERVFPGQGRKSAPGRTRTRDPLLRRQPLYPTELLALGDHCAWRRSRPGHTKVAVREEMIQVNIPNLCVPSRQHAPLAAQHATQRSVTLACSPACSPSTTRASWPRGSSGPGPSSSTPLWRRRSSGCRSRSPSTVRFTRPSGARSCTPATSTARSSRSPASSSPPATRPRAAAPRGGGLRANPYRRGAAALLRPPLLSARPSSAQPSKNRPAIAPPKRYISDIPVFAASHDREDFFPGERFVSNKYMNPSRKTKSSRS